eukprot:753764_1
MSLHPDVMQGIFKMDIACYEARNLSTSWRSKRKHKETNKQIRLMQSVWQKAHHNANAGIKSCVTVQQKSAQNKRRQKEDERIDKVSTPSQILFEHDDVPLYICDQNDTEYTKLGTGGLFVIYNKQSNTAQIVLLADNECLLNQIMCNVLQQCIYNQTEQCIDWIGNNHASGCDTSKIIKCRHRIHPSDFDHVKVSKMKLMSMLVKCSNFELFQNFFHETIAVAPAFVV